MVQYMLAYPNSTEKTSDGDQQLNTVNPESWKVLEGHHVLWKRAGTVKYGGKSSSKVLNSSKRVPDWATGSASGSDI